MRLQALSWLAGVAVVVAVGAATISAFHARALGSKTNASTVQAAAAPDGDQIRSLLHPRASHITKSASGPVAAKPVPIAPAPAQPAAARLLIGSYQQQLINQDRAAAGLRPLTWSSCLASVAVANAVRLSR